jgi:putative transcriptional regulator
MEKEMGANSRFSAEMLEIMTDLHKAGCVDKVTMRKFEDIHFAKPKQFTAEEIIKIREKENVSQMVFAKCLNITKSTVVQWEHGLKHPNGAAQKLLSIVKNKGLTVLMTL